MIKSAVIAIIDAQSRILLLKNNIHKKQPGLWVLPGGKCDFIKKENRWETFAEAIVRELEEETGLNAVVFEESPFYISYKGILVKLFTARAEHLSNSEITISHEHSEFKWVYDIDIDSLNVAPGAKIIFNSIQQQLKYV
jgi:8-oxo-dGTP pyrophosphatase MutT (NUDIX family)